MSQFQENCREEGQTKGQSQIHRTLPATAGGPKNALWFVFSFTLTLQLAFFLYVEKQHKQNWKNIILIDIPQAAIWGYLKKFYFLNIAKLVFVKCHKQNFEILKEKHSQHNDSRLILYNNGKFARKIIQKYMLGITNLKRKIEIYILVFVLLNFPYIIHWGLGALMVKWTINWR